MNNLRPYYRYLRICRGRYILGILLGILVASSLSCIFDAYASRWRARICNFYFCERARERGEYLYRRIKAGRGNRRFQLKLVVRRELKRRQRRRDFAWWSRAIDRCGTK